MLKRLRIPVVLILFVLLGMIGWFLFAPGRVPEGQPAFTAIANASLDPVKEEFNRYADRTRIVLLLSPT